jgi:hypothetical protein
MFRITGGILQIAIGSVLILVLVLGAMTPPDEDASTDPIPFDPAGLRQAEGSSPAVDLDDLAGERPRGPGPGMFVAPWVMQVADRNEDGRLTPEEAAQFVRDADQDHKGSIDVGGLALAMSRPMVSPTRNGPGGPGRPGFRGPGPGGTGGWEPRVGFRPPYGPGPSAGRRPTAPPRGSSDPIRGEP